MVFVTTISEDERDSWDREVAKLELCHPFNAFGWGKVRAVDGWSPFYLLATRKGIVSGAAILLAKVIFPLPWSVLYMPRGPICNLSDPETIAAILQRAKEIARRSRAIFLRIDPFLTESSMPKGKDPFIAAGFHHLNRRWSYWNAPAEVVSVDLATKGTEEDLFLSMKKDARRGVKRAIKQGVCVRQARDIQDLQTFYFFFQRFAMKKGFMSRGYPYYKCLWDEYISRGNGVLLLAEHEEQVVGGILNLIFARKCLGMHGGVAPTHRKLNINELLEWEGMKWAKEKNCIWYSFRGKGPTASQLSFKLKFGSEVVALVGYYDLPFYPLLYHMVTWLESSILPRISTPLTKLLYMYRRFKA